MRCRLCGSTLVNNLEDGAYWCKECDRYFNKFGEVFYTEDGDICFAGRKTLRGIRTGAKYIDKKRIQDLFGDISSVKVGEKVGLSASVIYSIRSGKQDSARLETLDKISKAYNISIKDITL